MKGNKGRVRGRDRGVWLTWQSGQFFTGWDGEMVLRRVGIPILKRQPINQPGDHFGVFVPVNQAKFAEYNLLRAGVVLSSPLLNPRHANIKRAPLPPAWGKPAKPVGIMGWVHRILGMWLSGDTSKLRAVGSTKGRKP